MPRSKRSSCHPALPTALLLACVASTAALAGDTVWPAPPADPVVRLESVLSKLKDFEIAIQGPVEGKPRRIQKLGRPSGVAFDGRGRLLVSDARQRVLFQIDTDLGVALVFGSGTTPSLREPRGVVAHPGGTIYVADAGLGQVVAFDASGDLVAAYGVGALQEPTDVALSADGTRLYVADADAHSIGIFDVASRRKIDSFGSRGIGVGQFNLPTAIELDRAGGFLVADQLNERVQLFDPSGAFTGLLELGGRGGLSRPQGVAVAGSGRIFVTESAQSRVQVYDSDLEPLLTFGRNGLGQGEFLGIDGVAVSGDRLAVLDKAGGRVQLFRLHGDQPPAAQRRQPASRDPARSASRDTVSPVEPETEVPAPAPMPEPSVPAPEAVPERAEIAAGDSMASPKPGPAVEPALSVEPLPAPEPEASANPGSPARVAQQLLELVKDWAAAWSAQDVDRYLGFYSDSFRPADGSSLEEWSAVRRARVTGPDSIAVGIEVVETRFEEQAAEITFLQSYTSDRYSDRVRKMLRLVEVDGEWKIDRETVLETLRE